MSEPLEEINGQPIVPGAILTGMQDAARQGLATEFVALSG
jgi:hypothetical protein